MATYYSDRQTAIRGLATGAIYDRPSDAESTMIRKVANFYITPNGGEVNGEYCVLDPASESRSIPVGARIIPEQCKIRFSSDVSGTPDFKAQIKAGTTALTAATSTISATTTAISFAQPSGVSYTTPLTTSDELRLYYSTGASAVDLPTAGKVIVEVVYDVPAL